MKNDRLIPAIFLAFSALLSSCEANRLRSSFPEGNGNLFFRIAAVNDIDTKASSDVHFRSVNLSTDGIPLFVTPSVEVNRNLFEGFTPETKASAIDKTSLLAGTAVSGIPLSMLTTVPSATAPSIKSGWLKKNNDVVGDDYWSLYDSDDKKIDWEEVIGAKASFFSYYDNNDDAVSSIDYSNLSFTYEGIKSGFSLGTSSDSEATDAQSMDDLIVAYTSDIDHVTDHGTGQQINSVSLTYYHPLAAVRFKAPANSSPSETIRISRVTINNLKSKGTVSYNTSMTAFQDAFTWSDLDLSRDYAQKFSENLDDMTFFVVPQNLDSVVVTFNLVHEGIGFSHEHQISASASELGTSSWDQGYIYTYTLDTKVMGGVDIAIQEDFDDGDAVKSDVTIENKEHSTVFVRAKFVANWCTSSGKIVAECPLSGTNPLINTSDWLEGADGFYYCRVPVLGFHQSPVFIRSFTQPSDISGIPKGNKIRNLHVEMRIAAQAVECDSYSPTGTTYIQAAWGTNGKIILADGTDLLSFLKF